jgi:uncharacterized protein (TIGR02246 family)
MNTKKLLTLMGILIAGACSSGATIDREANVAALRETAEAYHAAASGKDAQAVITFYADDAMMVPPNADRVEGIEGVRNYRFGFIETPGVELRFETIRVEVASGGDMGWTLAIGDVNFTRPDGEPGSDRVRDFHVWKKQDDGSWKVVVDMWNSEFPAGGD